MKINVEIIDEIAQYEIAKNSVLIGSTEGCDIILEYEGIGAEHIRITKELGKFYFEDLASDEETLFNQTIVIPGSKRELPKNVPIEIGGILIHLDPENFVGKRKKVSKKKKRSKKTGKRKNTTNKKNIDFSVVLYAVLLVFAGGSIFNFFHNRNKVELKVIKKDMTPTKGHIVELGRNEKIKPFRPAYYQAVNLDLCSEACLDGADFNFKQVPVYKKIMDSTLYLGFNLAQIKNIEMNLFYNSLENSDELKQFVETNYDAYFTFDEFKANSFVSPFQSFVYSAEEYAKINLIMGLLNYSNFFKGFSDEKVEKIHVFAYEQNKNIFTINDFIEYGTDHIDFLVSQMDSIKKQTSYFYKFKLTNEIEKFYQPKVNTSLNDFDPNEYDIFLAKQMEETYRVARESANCSDPNLLDTCQKMRKNGEVAPNDGAFIDGKNLTLIYDVIYKYEDRINEYKDYQHEGLAFKKANSYYIRLSGDKTNKSFRDYKYFYSIDGILFNESKRYEFDKNIMLVDFFSSPLFGEIMSTRNYQRVQLGMFQDGRIKFSCVFDKYEINRAEAKNIDLDYKILWRNRLPVKQSFLDEKCKQQQDY